MTDFDDVLADIQRERLTRVREIELRQAGERDRPHSGGVTLLIPVSNNTTQAIDLNVHELREWGAAMLAFADHIGDPAAGPTP